MSYAMAILSLYAYVTWLSHRELLSGGVLESHAGLLLPYPTIYNITMI